MLAIRSAADGVAPETNSMAPARNTRTPMPWGMKPLIIRPGPASLAIALRPAPISWNARSTTASTRGIRK